MEQNGTTEQRAGRKSEKKKTTQGYRKKIETRQETEITSLEQAETQGR